jgi:DNA-binding FadR family transcriptional regulator
MTVSAAPSADAEAVPPPARFSPAGPVQSNMAAYFEELIHGQAIAARIACEQMTAPALLILRDSVERASSLPTRPGWARKAAAHAEIFRLLADLAGDRAAAMAPGGRDGLIRDLMRTVGPAANGMITSSRQRLLAHLHAGDADGAALEMETHLRVLRYMWRLGAAGGRRSSWLPGLGADHVARPQP